MKYYLDVAPVIIGCIVTIGIIVGIYKRTLKKDPWWIRSYLILVQVAVFFELGGVVDYLDELEARYPDSFIATMLPMLVFFGIYIWTAKRILFCSRLLEANKLEQLLLEYPKVERVVLSEWRRIKTKDYPKLRKQIMGIIQHLSWDLSEKMELEIELVRVKKCYQCLVRVECPCDDKNEFEKKIEQFRDSVRALGASYEIEFESRFQGEMARIIMAES